ncbi:MAG: GEVED domain-containing protein [Flavobacterium sp.]|uniref:GEVED domain-containing protein n=1 Tax=Flavobacterium sp. TaxID=239 RepID=UPI003265A1A1
MKKFILGLSIFACGYMQAQTGKYWSAHNATTNKITATDKGVARLSFPKTFSLYDLNTAQLRNTLFSTINRSNNQTVSITLPNADGQFEQFEMIEASNFDPALQAQFPEIRAYSGKGITDRYATIKLSISPQGIQTMIFRTDKENEFIEPYSQDHSVYAVFKSQREKGKLPWTCSTDDHALVLDINSQIPSTSKSSSAQLRVMRLAQSCNGEYAAYFGASTAGNSTDQAKVLAAFNATLTRCNGVYEKDLALHLNLIANTTSVIFYNAATDPYSTTLSSWNASLQTTLTNTIGAANYDIGHMFGASGGGGNAGCIGCVCDSAKGSGITSPADGIPQGDNFDIDYVVHEVGHQLGGNHTFSNSNEGSGVSKEVGSGVTIMGYAGITSQDIAPHSIDIYHEATIAQIQANLATKTCPVTTSISANNATPIVNAGLDYTIPKSTPFTLTGSATDANTGDALTYCWEQNDDGGTQTGANSVASIAKTSGPNWRSWSPTASPTRYFPIIQSVVANSATTAGTGNDGINVEALSSVARTLNFRLTVRDNAPYSSVAPIKVGQTNYDDMVVTVNATAGPFTVSSPNTAVSYAGGSSQTVTWNVAGTTANGVNCANVNIYLSTDGGLTYPVALLLGTPNDGSEVVTIPNTPGTTNRIMVKGANHIFFDISNVNFTITSGSTDTVAPSAPTTLVASGTTQTTTNLSWTASTDNVGVTGYDVYQGTTLKGSTTTATTFAVTGLTASTAYTFSVKAKDAAGNISAASNVVNVTTLSNVVDTTAPSAPSALTASGTTSSSTNLSWTASTDNVGVTGYDVYQGGVFKANVATTSYTVTGLTAATAYSFYVIARDAAGNISVASNTVNVTTLTTSITYCASQGNSTADEKIGRVAIGSINNASTGTAGYEDFTSLSTNITQNSAVTITVTPSWTSTVYPEAYAVFIDYNKNGLFTDAGETVYTKAASTTTPASGSFTVPATALTGATRMRVSMKYNAVPTACEAFSYGQVEDYTVNIVAGTADTVVPTAPTALTASGTTQTTTNLSWTASTDNVGVIGYDIYQGTTLKGSVAGTTFTVTALTASTAYTFSVKAKDAAGNISASSNVVSVTTLAPTTITYCTSTSSNTADEKIGKVVFGTISNTSTGTAGYENFTALSTNAAISNAYTITITPSWTSTVYSEGYAVWIDYNQNGLFTDAGELVFSKATSTTTPVTGTFTIPSTAVLGTTRMRVSMGYNAIPTSCQSFTYGQVEDYTVNITALAKQTQTAGNGININLFPNPTSSILNVTSVSEKATFRVYNLLGQTIMNGKISNGSIDVSNINSGNYILEISDNESTFTKRFVKQ